MKLRIDSHAVLTLDREITRTEVAQLRNEFRYPNPDYQAELKRLNFNGWGGKPKAPEFLQTYRVERTNDLLGPLQVTVSRGAVERLAAIFGIEDDLDALRGQSVRDGDTTLGRLALLQEMRGYEMVVEMRDYQVEQCAAAERHRDCLWRAPPGSGKTTATLNLSVNVLKLPTIVVVPTEKIFEQWIRRVTSEVKNGGRPLRTEEVGVLKAQDRRIRPITIAMQQTLRNMKVEEYGGAFGLLVADEVQRHGAETFFDVTDHSMASRRLGVSADEQRADGKEFLIYDLFGPVRHEVERERLVADGSLVEAKIVVVPTSTSIGWYESLHPRHRGKPQVVKRLQGELMKHEQRNDLVERLMRESLDSDQPTLVLTWRLEHAHDLYARAVRLGQRAGLMIGGKENSRAFELARLAMIERKMRCAVGTYQAVGVGFDLPALGRGVFAMPCANSRTGRMQFEQFCGRYERPAPGKRDAVIYYLWDQRLFGQQPLRNLAGWKTNVVVRLPDGREVTTREYLKHHAGEAHQASDDLGGIFE